MTQGDKDRKVILEMLGNDVYFREIPRAKMVEIVLDEDQSYDDREKDLFVLSEPAEISCTDQVDYHIPLAIDEDDWAELMENIREEEEE